ncbi:MAG: NAD(P)-binding domain-containing protein, partial [Lentihominibacter sp.]
MRGGVQLRTGFIGAGKVGTSLGKYFSEGGLNVKGYYSRSAGSAQDAARFTATEAFDDMEALVKECDVIFLTVPDG